MFKKVFISIICFSACGCATRLSQAPIENMTNIPNYVQPVASPTVITPNRIDAIPPSQTLPVQMAALDSSSDTTIVEPAPVVKQIKRVAIVQNGDWVIPTKGKSTIYTQGNKGVEIYGVSGQVIEAVNDGKVVYSGNGLKGYGNLIIIKHSNSYLSAYAHNKVNLAQEGALVKRGQKIAVMGKDDSGNVVLHFELRKDGKPIDPYSVIGVK